MPVVTSYTEATLATFMVGGSRAETAAALSWTTASGAITEAVGRAERLLGVSDVADATDMAKVEAVARLVFWRAAKAGLTPAADWAVDNESLKKSQLWEHAKAMVLDAEAECADLGIAGVGGSGVVTIHPVERSEDPYGLSELTEDAG